MASRLASRVRGVELRVQGSVFRAQGLGLRVALGFRVKGVDYFSEFVP